MVEWDGLENRCGLRSTEGSNPSLPAERNASARAHFYFPPSAPIEAVIYPSDTMFEFLLPRSYKTLKIRFAKTFRV